MGYKILGWAVWHGAKVFLRRRYGRYLPSKQVSAGIVVALLVAAGAIAAARRESD
jgi:hypothetical protein